MTESAHPHAPARPVQRPVGPAARPLRLLPVDAVRGFLIGTAELVPGVSGGTVALVTGVYEELIDAAHHAVSAVKTLLLGPDRLRGAARELRRTDWRLLVPVVIGMAAAVLGLAGVMSSFVTDHPEAARGLFFGLVAASVVVPLRMLPPRRAPASGATAGIELVVFLAAIGLAVLLTSIAGGRSVEDPPLPIVALAAAVAVCALVVPGVSGSFFLLAVGLYTATLDAVHERDLAYMGVFALGAIAGLASFVKLLHHLLHRHRRLTLLVMTGLMIGSLRALWPWQSEGAADGKGSGGLLPPGEPWLVPVLLALLGAAAVLVLVAVEHRVQRRAAES